MTLILSWPGPKLNSNCANRGIERFGCPLQVLIGSGRSKEVGLIYLEANSINAQLDDSDRR